VVKVGKTIATIEVHLRDDATGVLVAQVGATFPILAALLLRHDACRAGVDISKTLNALNELVEWSGCVLQGTHVKFIAENEPTMAALIQQQLAQQQQQRGEQQEPQALMTTLRSKL
jgi:hypothetical protein